MAHYFPGRRLVREVFRTDIVSNKLFVQCAIYERFEFRKSFNCACGQKVSLKLTKTEGVSKKISATIESSVEGSLGIAGLGQLKSSIKAAIGAEVNWTDLRTEEINYECDPPKCGALDQTIYQLVREYELAIYKKGGGIFRDEYWDKKWSGTIPEEIGSYAQVPDCLEIDERCKCPAREIDADYDGRVSIDFGDICILSPYRLTGQGIDMRLERKVVSFPFYKQREAMSGLKTGLQFTFERAFLPADAIFLGNLQGESFLADVRFYLDPGGRSQTIEEAPLEGTPSLGVMQV